MTPAGVTQRPPLRAAENEKAQREERLDKMLAEARKSWTQGHPATWRGNRRKGRW